MLNFTLSFLGMTPLPYTLLHLCIEFNQGLVDSKLLEWLTLSCPLLAIIGDAIVVHGGISSFVTKQVDTFRQNQKLETGILPTLQEALHHLVNEQFTDFWKNHLIQDGGIKEKANSITDPLDEDFVTMVSHLVEYRGYFVENAEKRVQETMHKWLNNNDSITRIIVGRFLNYAIVLNIIT